MNDEYIELKNHEYEPMLDGIRALVSVVVEKLPKAEKKRYQPLAQQADALRLEQVLIASGIIETTLREFVNLNAGQNATGRSFAVVVKLLSELQRLVSIHGAMLLNAALLKVVMMNNPEKATLPYLKAVLKNGAYATKATTHPQPLPGGEKTAPVGEGWPGIKEVIRRRINESSFRTWIEPLRLHALTPVSLVLACPDEAFLYWLREHYQQVFREAFAAVTGCEAERVDFIMQK